MLPLSISCCNPSQEEKKKKELKEYIFLNFKKVSDLSWVSKEIEIIFFIWAESICRHPWNESDTDTK